MEKPYLGLRFRTEAEYLRALEFFESEFSSFSVDTNNDEFQSLHFEVQDQEDAESTERYMTEELIENGFDGYWFEGENL